MLHEKVPVSLVTPRILGWGMMVPRQLDNQRHWRPWRAVPESIVPDAPLLNEGREVGVQSCDRITA